MAINPNIKKKADDIRTRIKGVEVRESLASGLEAMSSDVVETVGRQDEVEGQFQSVIENTTDKDVISAPEIIAARDGEANLKARLDKEKNEVTTQLDHKELNVLDYGAVGDGIYDNWEIIQGVIEEAEETGKGIYIPSGEYFVSKPLRTRHMSSSSYNNGITVRGDGRATQMIGSGTDVVDYSDLTTTSNDSVFAIHGGNNTIKNLMIRNARVGIFMGQHPDSEALSGVGNNTFERLWISNVGTGILTVHSAGIHYNKFKNLYMMEMQIGIHLSKGLHYQLINNTNRNKFEDIRVNRCWIGLLVDNGDGNHFNSIFGEGIKNNHMVVGNQPNFIPDELDDKAVFILNLVGDENRFNNVFSEDCDFDLYSTGYRTTFSGSTLTESKILFPRKDRPPLVLETGSLTRFGYIVSDFNGSSKVYPIEGISPDIEEITSSQQRTKMVGKTLFWDLGIRFKLVDGMGANDKLRIKIPYTEDNPTMYSIYTRHIFINHTFTFPVIVGQNDVLENSFASVSSYSEEVGGAMLMIHPPKDGWSDDNRNGLFLSLHFDMNPN